MASWAPGPNPFVLPLGVPQTATAASAEARMTYFHERAGATLYGNEASQVRWHRLDGQSEIDGCVVESVEILKTPVFIRRGPEGFAILHLLLPLEDPISGLSQIVRLSSPQVRERIDSLIGPAKTLKLPQRATHITYLQCGELLPLIGDALPPWTPLNQMLWPAAAATPLVEDGKISAIRPDPEDPEALLGLTYLSDSWRSLTLRDGVAFVSKPEAQEDSFLIHHAPVYVRSIYLDALLLGMIQHRALNEFANRLSILDEQVDRYAAIPLLEVDLTRFRNSVWWQHVTSGGHANAVLLNYQREHRLPDLLLQITSEFFDFARQVDADSSTRTGAALGLITLFGLPLTLALTADQVFSTDGRLHVPADIISGLLFGLLLLLLPAARDLLQPLRRMRKRRR